jgi:hypothetical protein
MQVNYKTKIRKVRNKLSFNRKRECVKFFWVELIILVIVIDHVTCNNKRKKNV